MKLKKYISILFSTVLLIMIHSCSTDSLIEMEDASDCELELVAMTREGDIEERTYRVIGVNYNFYFSSSDLVYEGTYKGVPGQKMIPCKLNPDGSIDESATDEEHFNCSIGIPPLSRRWMYISPGIELIKKEDTSYSYCIPYNPYKSDLLMSTDVSTRTVTKGLKFDALVERRARIKFNVYIGDNNHTVKQLKVDELTLLGAGDSETEVSYFPWIPQTDNMDLSVIVKMKEADEEGSGSNRYTNSADVYVASGYYAPKSVVLSQNSSFQSYALWNSRYLQAEMTLKLGEQGEVNIAPILTDKVIILQPMHEYTYNFIVNTEYVNVTLEVCDCGSHPQAWQQENTEDGDQVIGSLGDKVTIDLGKWKIGDDGGWTPAISEDQII